MIPTPIQAGTPRAEFRYHLLRAAIERFQSNPDALDPEQMAQADRQAQRTFELESRVLASPEARDTLIPEPRIDEALAELAARYPDQEGFREDLARNGLDETTLRLALRRELIFDAVMQRVGERAVPVSEIDERLFHELHRDRFTRPEQRVARHILITINESMVENQRPAALARIERIAAKLRERPERFGQLARRYSECPTALEEGRLGTLPRGQLFPALDAALFVLQAGQVSGILESEVGFHLLLCEAIHPATTLDFDAARPRIHAVLTERRRREVQKDWLATLRQSAGV